MTWLREDDRETLDARIGALTSEQYRALHALRQLVAREQDSRDTGIFHQADRVYAVYATPSGPRSLSKKTLERLHDLDLVRGHDDYTTTELEALGIEWPDGGVYYRIHNWEKYNPPRDNTAAERKRRQRARNTNGHVTANVTRDVTDKSRVTDRDSHGPSRADARRRNDHDHEDENEEQQLSRAVTASNDVAHDEPANGPGSEPDEEHLARLAGITPNFEEP